MKITLLGYMGSGKSTVGKELAHALHIPFKDLDDYIIEKEGMSIKEIFQEKGEIYFRLQESRYLKELLHAKEDLVLALGGGTPCYADNMNAIKKEAAHNSSQLAFLQNKITDAWRSFEGWNVKLFSRLPGLFSLFTILQDVEALLPQAQEELAIVCKNNM